MSNVGQMRFCVSAMVLFLAACAAPVKEGARSGFISDYSNIEKVDDNAYRYVSDDIANYSKFVVDPVKMLYEPNADDPEFKQEELDELVEYFGNSIEEALTKDDGYELVSEPGPGVARIRAAITQVDDTIGALNVTIYTKITGAGLGGAAMEGEIVDSVTGAQLAAVIQWGSGSRVLRAGYTHTGDAKILINRWTKNARERLDEKHGR